MSFWPPARRATSCTTCGTGLAIGPAQCVKADLDGSLRFLDHATSESVRVPLNWHSNLKAALEELARLTLTTPL